MVEVGSILKFTVVNLGMTKYKLKIDGFIKFVICFNPAPCQECVSKIWVAQIHEEPLEILVLCPPPGLLSRLGGLMLDRLLPLDRHANDSHAHLGSRGIRALAPSRLDRLMLVHILPSSHLLHVNLVNKFGQLLFEAVLLGE